MAIVGAVSAIAGRAEEAVGERRGEVGGVEQEIESETSREDADLASRVPIL